VHVIVDVMHARVGGGLSYARSQLQALSVVRPDIELTLLASAANEETMRRVPGATVVPLSARNVVQRAWQAQRALRQRGRSADLLYCPGNMIPLLDTGLPTVMAMQNQNCFGEASRRPVNRTPRRRLRRQVSLRSLQRADRVIVISRSLADEMRGAGVWNDRCLVLPSGTAELPPEAAPVPLPVDGRPFFLSLANDYAHKHLDVLAEGWGRARRASVAVPFPRLVFAGEVSGRRRTELRARAGVAPDDERSLVFLGAVPERPQVRWLLEQAVAMVSTSDLEAFPLTPVEAGAAGCPVLLTEIPPHREIAADRAQFFPPADSLALASLLLRAARGAFPRERWAWPVTWPENAERLGAVFDEVVATPERVTPGVPS
jgi:glycosyltransferase involved in cell wall biosynthesis